MKIAAFLTLAVVCCVEVSAASAQAIPNNPLIYEKWQIGVGGSLVNPDYTDSAIPGYMVYGTYSPIRFFGLEAKTRYAYKGNGEREFSISGGYRFSLPLNRCEPFVGALIGYGHFSDAITSVVGNGNNSFLGGLDVRATRHVNVRLFEVESQAWTDFPPNGLGPVAYSAGVAYRP
jgi:hypothetical protein